jgi:hypothetical protein
MTRSPIRVQGNERPLLDIFSAGRAGPPSRLHFSRAQIEQIARTVRRTPEVMVKVTGGGGSSGAVSAHFGYISRHGELEIETDEGERIPKEEQKEFLEDWHLELTAGQYRAGRDGKQEARKVKLVHKIVLSMPAPTPPEKVLAAARMFAREKFALQHRYAMVLHTDQAHPHVHMVVKAEGEHGRRLHVDKETLREWREDFARMMREQGVAANATPRVARGQSRHATKDSICRAQRRGASTALRDRVASVVKELKETGTIRDSGRRKLVETRKAVVDGWMRAADVLDRQGEISLAGDVRYFAKQLPPILTDRERIAAGILSAFSRRRAASRMEKGARSGVRQDVRGLDSI